MLCAEVIGMSNDEQSIKIKSLCLSSKAEQEQRNKLANDADAKEKSRRMRNLMSACKAGHPLFGGKRA